jgi:hypothetical protein
MLFPFVAAGPTRKKFKFGGANIEIQELSFVEGDLGWQTWPAEQLLSKFFFLFLFFLFLFSRFVSFAFRATQK